MQKFFSEKNEKLKRDKKIEKLFINYLKKMYMPIIRHELANNFSEEKAEYMFKIFLQEIKNTKLMDEMIVSFNRKMSGKENDGSSLNSNK